MQSYKISSNRQTNRQGFLKIVDENGEQTAIGSATADEIASVITQFFVRRHVLEEHIQKRLRPIDQADIEWAEEKAGVKISTAQGTDRYALHDTDFMEQTTEGKPGISLRLGNKFVSLQSEGEGGRNYTRDMIEGQAGENMPEGKPISEDFPDVVVQTNAANLKNDNKELYNAAKAGDRQAAEQLIVPLLKYDKLQSITQAHPGAIVVYPHAEESAGRNKIPAAYANALVEAGAEQGLELDTSIIQANKLGHTGADTRHRTIMRTRFSGEVQAGRDYILVDDVYTSGATMRDLKDYIESKGGNVVFITTMAKGRIGTLRVVPTAAEKQALRDQGITGQQLRQYGITNSIENLTANEAASLQRLLADRRGDRGSSQGQTGESTPVARVLESPLGEGEGTAESGEVTPKTGGTDSYSLPEDRTLPEEPGYPLRDFITDPLAHVRDNLSRVAEREEGDRPLDWTDPYEAFRRPRTAALELSRMTDAELLERTRTAEAGTHDWNFFNDEYNRRHRQEYADLTDHHRAILDQSQPTLDDAYAMLAAADQHFHYGGHARPERTELLAQRHTLQDYIDRKEAVFQIQKTNISE